MTDQPATGRLYRDEADDQWGATDSYLATSLVPTDPVLDELLRNCEAEGLPLIQVNPLQAQMLWILVRSVGARRVLEVGTLGGYSSTWLGRAVGSEGSVFSVEADPHFATVATNNIAAAGLADVVRIEHGDGVEVVSRLVSDGAEPFDFVFLDVDRVNNTKLLPLAKQLSHERTLMVVSVKDLLRETRGMVAFLDEHPDHVATALQAVGSDGFHGFLVVAPRKA